MTNLQIICDRGTPQQQMDFTAKRDIMNLTLTLVDKSSKQGIGGLMTRKSKAEPKDIMGIPICGLLSCHSLHPQRVWGMSHSSTSLAIKPREKTTTTNCTTKAINLGSRRISLEIQANLTTQDLTKIPWKKRKVQSLRDKTGQMQFQVQTFTGKKVVPYLLTPVSRSVEKHSKVSVFGQLRSLSLMQCIQNYRLCLW